MGAGAAGGLGVGGGSVATVSAVVIGAGAGSGCSVVGTEMTTEEAVETEGSVAVIDISVGAGEPVAVGLVETNGVGAGGGGADVVENAKMARKALLPHTAPFFFLLQPMGLEFTANGWSADMIGLPVEAGEPEV